MNGPDASHTIRNARRWAPGGWRPWAGAGGAVALAFLARYQLHPLLGSQYPYLLFIIAALLVEFFFGLGPAIFAVVTGLLLGVYFFVPPYNSFLIPEPVDVFYVAGFLIINALAITLIEDLQRSKYALGLMRDVLQSRLEMLERSNMEREFAEKQAQEHSERFRLLAASLPQVLYMRRVDGEFEYLNEAFFRYTGLDAGLLGDAGWLAAVHPEDMERAGRACERVARSGNGETMQLRLRMADGRYEQFAGPLSRIEGTHGRDIKWVGSLARSMAAQG
jgi:PAS domain S-box-containing protein